MMKTKGVYAVLALVCVRSHCEEIAIHRVGYPEVRVNERAACGQRMVTKSVADPDYWIHTLFGGYSEGNCSAVGYTHFEKHETVEGHWLSRDFFTHEFDVYSRDPTFLDVAGCIYRECEPQLHSLESSPFVSSAAHCVAPAFGPCVPKAWDCLGDSTCRNAVKCLPAVAKECGTSLWRVVTDHEEREKLACMWNCNSSKLCILEKCGKEALECFTGIGDPMCHEAFKCIPEKTLSCSLPAFKCIFDRNSGICRENLGCLAKGVGVCADPAVNLMTDQRISDLMYCANERCPAASSSQEVAEASSPQQVSFPHWPGQLGCMSYHCGSHVGKLLFDKDIERLGTCLIPGLQSCGMDLWDCLGDDTCQKDVQCWADGVWAHSSDLWKMVTQQIERDYDVKLYQCLKTCESSHPNLVTRAFCVAGTCGEKSAKCMTDPTCRHVFTDMPYTLAKCGGESIMSPKFRGAAKCVAKIAGTCGLAGIELIRDRKLADVVVCNHQCARPPLIDNATIVV